MSDLSSQLKRIYRYHYSFQDLPAVLAVFALLLSIPVIAFNATQNRNQNISAATLLPAPTAANCPYSPGAGDVDVDGYVTNVDALKVLRYVANLSISGTFNKVNADVDAEGRVTSRDALLILRYIAGLINTFPICTTGPIRYPQ